jgi:hypothetical protein
MDALPASIGDSLYGWSIFAILSAISLMLSVTKANSKAAQMDDEVAEYGKDGVKIIDLPVSEKRAAVLTLVFYTISLYYMTMIFFVLMIYGAINLFHTGLDALFRRNTHLAESTRTRRTMHILDKYMNPSIMFAFVSARHWPAHVLIFLAILFASAMYTVTISDSSRKNRRQDSDSSSETSIARMYSRTIYSTIHPVFWVMYSVVVLRELTCVVSPSSN